MIRRIGVGFGLGAALMISAPPAWSQTQTMGPTQQSPMNTLHHALNLSQAQDPAWKAYREGAAAPTKSQDRRRAASQMFPSLTAPQRMDLVEAEMKQELLDLQQQSQVLKVFYDALSPEQRTVFDAQTLPPADQQQQQQQGQ